MQYLQSSNLWVARKWQEKSLRCQWVPVQAQGQLLLTLDRVRNQAQTPSLLGLILLRSLCTPWTSTTISGIEGKTSPEGVGMVVVSSTENTEVNCRFRMSALDWLSENSRPPSLSGDIPVLSQCLALTNFQKGLVSLSIKALSMILVAKLSLACLMPWLILALHDLYLAHMVSLCFPAFFLAFPKRRFFFLDSLFRALVIHGALYLEKVRLDGTYLSNRLAHLLLKAVHFSSTEEAWYNWSYSSLKLRTSVRRDSQSAFEKIWTVLGAFLVQRGAKLQSQNTASWSDSPGITCVLLTWLGELVRTRSRILSSLVQSVTSCVKENAWTRERKKSCIGFLWEAPLTQLLSKQMSGRLKSPPRISVWWVPL